MKAVLVDDEYYALQGLKMELDEIGGIEIVGMFEDGQKMLDEIKDIQPDIIFMDIEMPKMNGFELFKQLMDTGCVPNTVFVTAYSQYAVKAFEINAMDYIIKPVTRSRLMKTLERVKSVSVPKKTGTIQIKCFRHFSILVDGREINSGWRTRKAEELIAFLIGEKGSFVSKDKIAEALWPEQERETAMSNLYMAYFYINRQEDKTGARIPIESERGRMRINAELIKCDMLEFDKLIDAGNRGGSDERAACMEKAAALYQGSLFEDGYYAWADTIQSNYEYRYVELLDILIEYYRKNGDRQKMAFYEEKLRTI